MVAGVTQVACDRPHADIQAARCTGRDTRVIDDALTATRGNERKVTGPSHDENALPSSRGRALDQRPFHDDPQQAIRLRGGYFGIPRAIAYRQPGDAPKAGSIHSGTHPQPTTAFTGGMYERIGQPQ